MSALSTGGRPITGSGPRSRTMTPLLLALFAAFILTLASVLKVVEWVQLSNAAQGARETIGGEIAGPGKLMLAWAIAEIVIALGIVVFRHKAWMWSLASLLFGVFAGYLFVLMVRGEASCGCFGNFSPPPVVMFTVDALMAIACATLASRSWGFAGFRGIVLTIAGVGSITGAAVASSTTEAKADENIDPLAVLRELSVMAPVVEVSRDAPYYLIYIYNKFCPACQTHYPGMKRFTDATADHPSIHGLLLETDEIAALAEAEGKFLHGSLWGAPPLTLLMRNGQVVERFESNETPNPASLFERLTGQSYEALIANDRRMMTPPDLPAHEPAPVSPTGHGPNTATGAMVDSEEDYLYSKLGLVGALQAVPGDSGHQRFEAIFQDRPGGVHHLLYAHTNCGVCIEYRRDMLEVQGMVDDVLIMHFAMAEQLVDDGVPLSEWDGAHAALLFDGGKLIRWYGDGEVSGDLPLTIADELASP